MSLATLALTRAQNDWKKSRCDQLVAPTIMGPAGAALTIRLSLTVSKRLP